MQKKGLNEYNDIFSDSEEEIKAKQQKPNEKKLNYTLEDGQYLFDLNRKKRVCVSQFKGEVMVSLREYFEKDGQLLPTKKGITLNTENWRKLKEFINDIDECVKKIKK